MYKVDILTENKDGVYQNDEDFKTGPACFAVLYALSQGAMPLSQNLSRELILQQPRQLQRLALGLEE